MSSRPVPPPIRGGSAVVLPALAPHPAVRLAAWGTAWLAGHVGADAAVDALLRDGDVRFLMDPVVDLSAAALSRERQRSASALGDLRRRGVAGLRLVLPVPGDPAGLPGPAALTQAAVAAGGAVVAVGRTGGADGASPLVLVPEREGLVLLWRAHPADGPAAGGSAPTVAEAERALKETLLASTEALVRLDVARWRPEIAGVLSDLRAGLPPADELPPGYPPRARSLRGLAGRIRSVVALALTDEGGAVDARAMAARRAALAPLERASRHAEVAAVNALLEPPA